MSFIESPLEKKIHPYRKKITLREGIEDFVPYEVTMPDPPEREAFINHGVPVEKQFFKREDIPSWVWTLTKQSGIKDQRNKVIDIASSNKEYAAFIQDQKEKAEKGIFIYVYGIPLWIPPSYWWFLNYYHIEGALPDFRFVDLEYWYWWELCVVANKNVYGGIEFTQRRDGKSLRLSSNCLFLTINNEFFNAGLQSKTNEDAKDLFQRGIVLAWHRLPFYFAPKFDNKAYPVKEINFRDPKNVEEGTSHFGSSELNSWIEARPSVYTAFDGTKLKFYGFDEAGKAEEMLASQAWRVHKQCLRVRGDIIGKAIITTTIEETTKGGLKEFKKIWDDSDMKKLTRLGQTESGLIPYFKAAHETFVFDQYGFSIIGEPQLHQKKWRFERGDQYWDKGGQELVDIEIESHTDPIEKQRYIRMYPRNIREAFRTDVKNCHFNIAKIEARLDDFRYGNFLVTTGNLYFVNGVQDGEVAFREQVNGRWSFKKSLIPFIEQIANKTHNYGGELFPANKALGVIDCDPYKYNNVEDVNRRSRGTAHAYIQHIPEIDRGEDELQWETDDLFMEYSFRGSVAEYNEDIILTCLYLGMPVSCETNSGNVSEHLTSRGFHRFLKFRKKLKKKQGHLVVEEAAQAGFITGGDSTKKPLFDAADAYIEEKCHKCVFPNFLQDCKDVEYDNLNPYDYFVSGANAIFDAGIGQIRIKRPEAPKTSSAGLWSPTGIGGAATNTFNR